MQKPLVSIMMPAYNAGRYIQRSIETALGQTYPHWELILVNDGSTDDTAAVAGQFNDPRIRIFHQPNGGEAAARNTALRHMRGEYLTFLDADDLYLPHHLQVVTSFLQSHPDCDGVYTDGYYIDQDGKRLKPLSARRRGPFTGDIFEEVMRSSDVFGAPLCVAVKTELVHQRGLQFDPQIVIGPDWDFLIDYAEAAHFGYIDQATCEYRVHQSQISSSTGSVKRSQSLARCREKAVHRRRFMSCSTAARAYVFYDLLINLLRGCPDRQAQVMGWAAFQALPHSERARLARLAAVEVLKSDGPERFAGEWLRYARRQNPRDIRGAALHAAYSISPRFCSYVLRLRQSFRPETAGASPFADLLEG